MTYSESEHSILLRKIGDIVDDKSVNPLEAFFYIKKLMAIYNKLPVYPGVIPEIFEKSQYEVDVKSLEKGDYVLIYSEKDCITGSVKELGPDGTIRLNHLGKLTEYKSKTFDLKNITRIYCVNERPEKKIVETAEPLQSDVPAEQSPSPSN